MTEAEYCLTSNLARLRDVHKVLLNIHACKQITGGQLDHITVGVDMAILEHETAIHVDDD